MEDIVDSKKKMHEVTTGLHSANHNDRVLTTPCLHPGALCHQLSDIVPSAHQCSHKQKLQGGRQIGSNTTHGRGS
ncbi:hypothetical protein PAXRUDRAFT_831467 [Paxillus rubicundulus Ve08.2h10]|uniref:Unplaced genomic scaffold scaffold_659, whole genome shotgun sequence n=1 Tax=Paxillus rubicundulus Ve08.2h10 TaxID=930991 RepID=A0A0D0DRY5_9AGAM|nr:hypothetical protein PAXRUDRAFT_831467 [Paxillus rubicundulus Ve08.2h10]